MTSKLRCFLLCLNPRFRSILIPDECLLGVNIKNSSREFSRILPSNYDEKKYTEMKSRLTTVPYLDLLEKEVDGFKRDLCYEDDQRKDDLGKWNSLVFDYNTKVTRLFAAETFLKAFCAFGFSIDDPTWNQWDSDKWRSAAILAWCIETTSVHITMFDDILDKNVKRRQNLCWHKKPEIGLIAVHDALALQWSIYKVLWKHFGKLKCYLNVVEEIYKTNRIVAYGQRLAALNKANQKSTYENFTFEIYNVFVENKAVQFMCMCPVHIAMHLNETYSSKESDFIKKICWKIGLLSQILDDSFDLVLPMEFTGLKGNDIRNGKLTWFAIKFLEEAPESMKKYFMENYGVDKNDAVENIFELYEKANMMEKFHEFEIQAYLEISSLIESTTHIKGAFFYDLLHRVQSRKID